MQLAVTGHRPPKVGGYRTPNFVYYAINEALALYFDTHDISRVFTGMSLGVDQWVAELCISRGLPFTACLPFQGFEGQWPENSQMQFRQLCNQADDVVYVSESTSYSPRLLQARNEYMVDHANHLLAVYNGVQEGGTWSCIRYAQMRRKSWEPLAVEQTIWAEALQLEQSYQARRAANTTQQLLSPARPRRAPRSAATLMELLGAAQRIQNAPPVPPVEPRTPTITADSTERIPPEKRFIPGRVLDLDD